MILSLKTPSFLPPNSFLTFTHLPKCPKNPHFICYNKGGNPYNNKPNKISDADLASDFAAEVHKLNTQLEDTQVAMNKSKQLLFSDFCNYLNSTPDEFKNSWKNLGSDDKLGLVKGFVSDWGLDFHPLSPKSVRDLVEEFVINDDDQVLQQKQSSDLSQKNDNGDNDTANSVVFFPTLKKLIMGFSSDN